MLSIPAGFARGRFPYPSKFSYSSLLIILWHFDARALGFLLVTTSMQKKWNHRIPILAVMDNFMDILAIGMKNPSTRRERCSIDPLAFDTSPSPSSRSCSASGLDLVSTYYLWNGSNRLSRLRILKRLGPFVNLDASRAFQPVDSLPVFSGSESE